tara:strand:- start:1598 stop:2119 length:522 start_codon:yes stop_codon:yes gene_type:complete
MHEYTGQHTGCQIRHKSLPSWECGHATCQECDKKLKQLHQDCPMCRAPRIDGLKKQLREETLASVEDSTPAAESLVGDFLLPVGLYAQLLQDTYGVTYDNDSWTNVTRSTDTRRPKLRRPRGYSMILHHATDDGNSALVAPVAEREFAEEAVALRSMSIGRSPALHGSIDPNV